MTQLSRPSRELATRLLTEVIFNDRIIGVWMHTMGGGTECFILSLREAVGFLKPNDGGVWSTAGWTCYIDPSRLQKWIAEVLNDQELAQAIEQLVKECDRHDDPIERYQKKMGLMGPIKQLMEQRLRQCEEVAGEGNKA